MSLIPRKQKIEIVKDYTFVRMLPGRGEIAVDIGDDVEEDSVVAFGVCSPQEVELDITKHLKVSASEVEEYVTCLQGQVVSRGEVVAEKSTALGVASIVATAPQEGVVDLRKVKKGKIVIKSVGEEFNLTAGVRGKVRSIIPHEKVAIRTAVHKISPVLILGLDVQAELIIISSSKRALSLKDVSPALGGKIIATDALVGIEVMKKAIGLGIKGLIVGGVMFEDVERLWGDPFIEKELEDLNFTLCTLEGFGYIPIPAYLMRVLRKAKNKLVFINHSDGKLIVPDKQLGFKKSERKKRPFSKARERLYVQVYDEFNWGRCGKIIDVSEDGVVVDLEDGAKVEVGFENLVALE